MLSSGDERRSRKIQRLREWEGRKRENKVLTLAADGEAHSRMECDPNLCLITLAGVAVNVATSSALNPEDFPAGLRHLSPVGVHPNRPVDKVVPRPRVH